MSTCKVIALANQKGGVAKTTTTLNLAVAFSEEGHRVLCVDMDPQGNLTMSQGIDPDTLEKSMYDVLVHHISIREVIRKREIDVACADGIGAIPLYQGRHILDVDGASHTMQEQQRTEAEAGQDAFGQITKHRQQEGRQNDDRIAA